MKLNGELWRQCSQSEANIERHIDEVVALQMMLKDRDRLLAQLNTHEQYHLRTAEERREV